MAYEEEGRCILHAVTVVWIGKCHCNRSLSLTVYRTVDDIFAWSSRLCHTRPCAIPGFECYVSEAIEAPPAVLTHLCKEKRINTVPIFSDNTRAEDVERKGFTRYFIGKRLHSVRDNSRYGLGTGFLYSLFFYLFHCYRLQGPEAPKSTIIMGWNFTQVRSYLRC